MRAIVVKRIRKTVYEDKQPRTRKYTTDKNGTVHADAYRRVYQRLKKQHND